MADDERTSPQQQGGGRSHRYRARHARSHARTPVGGVAARRLLVVVNLLVGVSLIAGALVVVYAEVQLHRIKHIPVQSLVKPGQSKQSQPVVGTTVAAGPPITVLIVGSDSRAVLNQPGDSAFGSPSQVGGARSDTIILARIVPATHQIELLSIPRDLYVPIPGLGEQKINAAFNNGPDLLVQVIKQQLGIDINHYIDVDFDTFREIADAVGGVSVYFPTPARDLYSGLGVPAGCVNLTNDQALAYVRSREYQYFENGSWHQEAESDLARIQRQQSFIRKLVKKSEATGISDPLQLSSVISGVTKNLTVDNSLSVSDMITLAKEFASVDPSTIAGVTLATDGETLSDGEDVLLPEHTTDAAQVAQFLALGAQSAGSATSTGTTTTTTTTSSGTGSDTTATPPATVQPSSVSLVVANGTRTAGQAGTTATSLRSIGFTVSGTVDSSRANTGSTEVLYGSGAASEAATVAAYVEGPVTLQESDQLASSSVELITGSGFTGISPTPTGNVVASGTTSSSSTSSTSSSTTSTTTPASTTTSTTYVLPGTPAGQTPPSCGS